VQLWLLDFFGRMHSSGVFPQNRKSKFHLAADGILTKTESTEAERKTSLIEEFGLSREIVENIPSNVPGDVAPPGLSHSPAVSHS
jgi:hypothetical protein